MNFVCFLFGAHLFGVVALADVAAQPLASPAPTEVIQSNDNRTPAGARVSRELHLSLDTRTGLWYPDDKRAPGIPMQAFSVAGKPLQDPGPLIRVAAGTDVVVSVHNGIEGATLTVHG